MTGHNNHHAAFAEAGDAIRRAKGADVGKAHLQGAKQRHDHLLDAAIHELDVGVTSKLAGRACAYSARSPLIAVMADHDGLDGETAVLN
jgi:hypothetical protein